VGVKGGRYVEQKSYHLHVPNGKKFWVPQTPEKRHACPSLYRGWFYSNMYFLTFEKLAPED